MAEHRNAGVVALARVGARRPRLVSSSFLQTGTARGRCRTMHAGTVLLSLQCVDDVAEAEVVIPVEGAAFPCPR